MASYRTALADAPITPTLICIVANRAAVFSALEAVAEDRPFALVLPGQMRDEKLTAVPPRPLRAGASEQARQLLALRAIQGDVATVEAAAEVLGVAAWPAAIFGP